MASKKKKSENSGAKFEQKIGSLYRGEEEPQQEEQEQEEVEEDEQ